MIQLLNRTESDQENKPLPRRDCLDLQRAGISENGEYKLYPDDGGDPFFVFCDMETNGGGWTVSKNNMNEITGFRNTCIYIFLVSVHARTRVYVSICVCARECVCAYQFYYV